MWGAAPAPAEGLELSTVCVSTCLCAGERAGTAGTTALQYWERTEGGEDKAGGDASAARVCVVEFGQIRVSTGCAGVAGSLWPSSGFHTGGASLHPANPGVRWEPGDRASPHLWDIPPVILAAHIGSALAPRGDARIADHPAVSSWAIWRTEAHSPCMPASAKPVCLSLPGREPGYPSPSVPSL